MRRHGSRNSKKPLLWAGRTLSPKLQEDNQNSEADPNKERTKEKTRRDRWERKCYNCNQRGHIAIHCSSAHYCEGISIMRQHLVGGGSVVDSIGCVVSSMGGTGMWLA